MKKVLIVAPHFAPIGAPDGQRVRMLAPHFAEFGWEPHILTVDSSTAETPVEPELLDTFPADLPVTRVNALSVRATRRFGLGNIAWRAWNSLRSAGHRLLRPGGFDLVYFSTTQFACLPLGRLWRHRWGVPFVVDLQDPWRSDYRPGAGVKPPGGWKYRFAAAQARWLEPWTLRRCSGVVSVSTAYLDQLARRYPWWSRENSLTLPMGWSKRDFAAAPIRPIAPRTIRYFGRLGADLRHSLAAFLAGLAEARRSGIDTQAEFCGGSYDPKATETAARRAAASLGLADGVREQPTRVPYLASLAALKSAGANLILGSDDDGYAPSKIWLVLAAGRPWLALARSGTELHRLLYPHTGPGGCLIDPATSDATHAVAKFCASLAPLSDGSADRTALACLEARELAREHARFFATIFSRP